MLITSRANANIKGVKRLFRRRERDRTGLFFAEGVQLVTEALEMNADISLLIVSPEMLGEEALASIAPLWESKGLRAMEVTPEVFASISPQDGLQGVGAVIRERWARLEDASPADGTCWVALNRIQHPGSLGTIIRVCDAVGGRGVILIDDSTDPYDPTAVRASLGAIFSQQVVRSSFAEFAAWTERHGCSVVGTSPAADTDYQAVVYEPPIVLLMGSERIGLSPEQQAICDVMVRIPMAGRCESHHVAVATGIVLYEVFNQRRARQQRPTE